MTMNHQGDFIAGLNSKLTIWKKKEDWVNACKLMEKEEYDFAVSYQEDWVYGCMWTEKED